MLVFGRHATVVEPNAWAADDVLGRRLHPSQEIVERADGGVTLKMRLNSLQEVERWVLSFGGHCTAVKPQELKKRIATVAADLMERFASAAVQGRGVDRVKP